MKILTLSLVAGEVGARAQAIETSLSTVGTVAVILEYEVADSDLSCIATAIAKSDVGLVSVWGPQSDRLEGLVDRYSLDERGQGPLTTSEGCKEPITDFARTVVYVYRGGLPLEALERPVLFLYVSQHGRVPAGFLAYLKTLEYDSERKVTDLSVSDE